MARKTKAAILISGRGSNMEALIKSTQAPDSTAEIAAVISNVPDAQGLRTARALGVAALCVDHKSFPGREEFEAEIDGLCRTRGVDLILCAGFMRLMTAGFVARWRGRMVNIHPSLLPSYPGLGTHARALKDQARIHGCSVHFVTVDLDGGPIIAQAAVAVMPEDTVETLAERVLAEEHRLYPMVLAWLAGGLVKLEGDRVIYRFEIARDQESLIAPRAKI